MDLRCKGGCQFKEGPGVSKVYRQHLPECQIQVQGPSKPAGSDVMYVVT